MPHRIVDALTGAGGTLRGPWRWLLALCATGLAVAAGVHAFGDGGSPGRPPPGGLAILAFLVCGGLLVAVCERLRVARRRLADAEEEHAATAERLRESETRLQLAIEGAGMGTWHTDYRSGRTVWDRQHARLLGLPAPPAPAVADARWVERLHPEDRDEVLARLRASRRSGEAFHLELRILRADDGAERCLSLYGRYQLDPDGVPVSSLGIVLDVTQRRRDERALYEAGRRLAAAMSVARLGVWEFDVRGRTLEFDPRCRELFGVPADAPFTLAELRERTHPEDRERMVAAVRAAYAPGGGDSYDCEYRVRWPDGTMRWLAARGLAIHDAPPDPRGPRALVGTLMDVTERREAQAAAEAESRRKDEFIATLAHELRNPLAPIRYAVRLLQPGAPPDVAECARRTIERQVAQLARLLEDLLDVARLTRGAIALRRERLDLRAALAEAVEAARPAAVAATQRLVLAVPDTPLVVDADPARLAQVIGHLLDNAVKYAEGEGTIELRAAVEGGAAVVHVRDSGVGMTPELLAQAFDAFVRAQPAGLDGRGGLGIGLSIARRLVELHGGSIGAASEGPGRGAEFTLRLPLAPDDGLRAPRAAPAAA